VAKAKNNQKVQKTEQTSANTVQNEGKSPVRLRPLGQSTLMTQRRRRRLNTKFIIGMAVWVIALAISLYFLIR
jgi:hypothetical protein